MNRLTYMDGGKWRMRIGDTEYSGKEVDRIAAYEETGMEPEDILSAMDMAKLACALQELNKYKELGNIDRLRELVEAYKNGLCMVAPCVAGDTVYFLDTDGSIQQETVLKSGFCGETWSIGFGLSDVGKTVFLSRESAEEALKERGKGVDNQNSG